MFFCYNAPHKDAVQSLPGILILLKRPDFLSYLHGLYKYSVFT
jgi:hypothetical protein